MTGSRPALPDAPDQGRIHAIDGMRLVAVLAVFVAHTQDMFRLFYQGAHGAQPVVLLASLGTMAGAAAAPSTNLGQYIVFIAPMGMALLFGLSGAGAWFALRACSARQYLAQRVVRLVPPLLVALGVLAPFQLYFQQLSNGTYHGSLLAYYPHFFTAIPVDATPNWIGGYFRHLWFLIDLFVFMILTLPLFALLKRAEASVWLVDFTTTLERPGGPAILVLPIIAIRAALGGAFPGYENWADQVCWLVFYVYGYLLLADRRRIRAVDRHGPLAAALGLGFAIALGRMVSATGDVEPGLLPQALDALTMCAWLVALTWFASILFTSGNSMLRYGNRVVLWFYVLHYPILSVAAYYVIPLDLPLAARALILGLTSFVLSLATADLLTRRRSHAAAPLRLGP